MKGHEFYLLNKNAFQYSMYAGYLACFQHDEIAEILYNNGNGEIITRPFR